MDISKQKQAKIIEQNIGFYVGQALGSPIIPPEHIYIPLTTRCNLKCKMCEAVKYPSRLEDEMSTTQVKKIIDQAAQLNIEHLIFSGGEPLLRTDFLELAEYAASYIKDVDIITNGMLFEQELIECLFEIRLNHITFSIDGLRKTNDIIRGKGVFDFVIEAIDRCRDVKEKKDLCYPTLGINFTIQRGNVGEMLPVLEMAIERGLNAILFQPILTNNIEMTLKNKSIFWPDEEEIDKLESIIEVIIDKKRELKKFVICNDEQMLKRLVEHFRGVARTSEYSCFEGIKRIVVTCDGKAWSCPGEYANLKEESLQDAWFSPKAQEMRKNVKKCSYHCLQDCVFSPSDLSEKIEQFLQKLSGTLEKKKIAKKLLEKVNFYKEFIMTILKDKNYQFLQYHALQNELGNLDLLYRRIESLMNSK